jgi:ribose 5-phosphate isomerase RpiB
MSRSRRVAIGADHGGFDLKARLVEHLRGGGHAVDDLGTTSRDAVDYPRREEKKREEKRRGVP